MLSKGASTAAVYAKDIGSQASAKASEIGGTVSGKVFTISVSTFKAHLLKHVMTKR